MRDYLLFLGTSLTILAIACGTDSPASNPSTTTKDEATPTVLTTEVVIHPIVAETEPPVSPTLEPTGSVPEPSITASPVEPDFILRSLPELTVTKGALRLAEQGGVFAELLEFLPDTVDTRKVISMRDFGPQWEAAADLGLERPDPEGDPAAIEEFIRGVFDAEGYFGGVLGEAFLCCPRTYLFSHQPLDDIGFDTRNVDGALWAGEPPREFTVVQGIYDPEVTAKRLDACAACVPHELREWKGLQYFRWNDDGRGDLRDRFAPPLLDHIGRGGRIYVGDGFAMHSYFDADMERMIDVLTGNSEALGDLDEFQLVARALIGAGAANVAIGADGFAREDFDFANLELFGFAPSVNLTAQEIEEIVLSAPLLAPFDLAAAVSIDEQRRSRGDTLLILVHRTQEAAATNAERLPGRLRLSTERYNSVNPDGTIAPETGYWGDAVGSIEISVDGKVLFALLSPLDPESRSAPLPINVIDRAGVLIHE